MNKRSQGEPDRQTLSDLLEKVRACEGADRELDRQIMTLSYVRDRRHIGASCWDDAYDTCCPGARHLDDVWVDPATDKWRTTAVDGFEFTSSLDAALALVERVLPGWTVSGICQDDFKLWHAELRKGHQTSYTAVAISHETLRGSANPALALLAALLTALLAEEAGK